MGTPFLGEIRIASFGFAPKGWALCNGQTLAINQYTALFSLLGTMYGGDGVTTFALPNLQGRGPVHAGNGYSQGQAGGEVSVTLTVAEMSNHTHRPVGVSTVANRIMPTGHTWADSPANPYGATAATAMNAGSVTQAGESQPHNNMAPYLVVNFIIALNGIFPTRS